MLRNQHIKIQCIIHIIIVGIIIIMMMNRMLPFGCRWDCTCGGLPWFSSCWSSAGLAAGRASHRGQGPSRPARAAAGGPQDRKGDQRSIVYIWTQASTHSQTHTHQASDVHDHDEKLVVLVGDGQLDLASLCTWSWRPAEVCTHTFQVSVRVCILSVRIRCVFVHQPAVLLLLLPGVSSRGSGWKKV